MALGRCLVVFAFSLCAALSWSQEPVRLELRADVGQKARYSSTSDVEVSASGEKLKIEQKEVSEIEVLSFEEGVFRFRRRLVSGSVKINGEEGPEAPEDQEPTEFNVAANGLLLSYEVPEEGETENSLPQRVARATNVVFSSDAVNDGSEWSHAFAADSDAGFRAAKAQYKLTGRESIEGRPAVMIEMSYAEDGDGGLKAQSTLWIEIATGDTIKTKTKFTNVELPFAPPGSSAEVEAESMISSGSMLASVEEETGPAEDKNPIDEKTEDYEKLDGLLPLYRKVEDGEVSLLLEISAETLGRRMMLQATAATGTGSDSQVVAGSPLGDFPFEFDRLPNERIAMVSPNALFRTSDPQFEMAVRRSFSDSILESFDIEAEHEGRILIDVSSLFTGNIARIYEAFQGGGGDNPFAALAGGGASMAPDRENTYILDVQNFPQNLVVASSYAFTGRGGGSPLGVGVTSTQSLPDSRGARVRVIYNLLALPEAGAFQPREFDPRIGYFTTFYRDMSRLDGSEQRRKPILRWNVAKKEPMARMSEAENPITFHLDPAIPEAFRGSVAAGILAWNEAFEAVGIRNAIIVRDLPEDQPMLHADMRYNTIRWVASPADAYAVALFRSDPDTGQILNASITVDAGIVNFGGTEYDRIVNPESSFDWEGKSREAALKSGHQHGMVKCGACADGAAVLAMGSLGAEFLGGLYGVDKEAYTKQFVKSIVMHEMGHILGLRHNFVASTQLSLDELGSAAKVDDKSPSASIMDYLPFNPSAIKKPGVDFFNEAIGDYDVEAIKFGYGTDAQASEAARLLASKGLAWQGDEGADSFDPYVTRFDIGRDPVEYWTRMMQISRYYLMNLEDYKPKAGESNYDFTRSWNILLNVYTGSARQLTRFVGGIRRFPDYPTDPGARPSHQAVPAAKQREALEKAAEAVFSDRAFAFPATHFQRLAADPKGDLLEGMMAGMNDQPIFSILSAIQGSALRTMLGAGTLERVQNNAFKAMPGSQPLQVIDVMEAVGGHVWAELGTAKSPDMLRRQLQRAHVERLIELGVREFGERTEVGVLAFDQLRRLLPKVQAARSSDRLAQAHYEDTARRIRRALDAVETLGGGGGGGGGSLLDLLLGGRKGGG